MGQNWKDVSKNADFGRKNPSILVGISFIDGQKSKYDPQNAAKFTLTNVIRHNSGNIFLPFAEGEWRSLF